MEATPNLPVSGSVVSPAEVTRLRAAQDELLGRFTANVALPRPPALVLRILEKASQPDCTFDELAKIIHCDPALCGKLLQTINSAIFGFRCPIISLDQALKMLGLRQIRSLVLSLSLPSIYEQYTPCPAVWEHLRFAVSMAAIAGELATTLSRPSPADDLVAGLLCDLGSIVIQQARPDTVDRLQLHPPEVLAQRECELEQEILGFSHADVSAHLLKSWRLPAEITEPVRCHHQPRLAEPAGAAAAERAFLLHFATQIANLQKWPLSGAMRQHVLDLAQRRFGMDERHLVSFLEPLDSKVQEFASLLKVQIGPCTNYAALLTSAAQELAKLTVETSVDFAKSRQNTPATALWRLAEPGSRSRRGSSEETVPNHPPVGEESARRIPTTNEQLRGEGDIHLGQYKVIEVLGRGGMGVVFRAFDTSLRRYVAIKTLGPWLISVIAHARARFAREAQAAALVNHENVVTVYAVEEVEDFAYLVMEYVDGVSLQGRLEGPAPLGLPQILQIGAQIASGLAAAHSKGVIHRDVKPANILLKKDTLQVKITDFGLARIVECSALTEEGTVGGTPQYMSPEQVRGDAVDFRTDLFSLGSVLYAMCTGLPPFGVDNAMKVLKRIADEKPTPLPQTNSAISKGLAEIIDRLLAKDPAQRIQSADEVARLLRGQLQPPG